MLERSSSRITRHVVLNIDQAKTSEGLEASAMVPAPDVRSSNPYRSDFLIHSFSQPLSRNARPMSLMEHLKISVQEIQITFLKQERAGLSVDLLIDAQDG